MVLKYHAVIWGYIEVDAAVLILFYYKIIRLIIWNILIGVLVADSFLDVQIQCFYHLRIDIFLAKISLHFQNSIQKFHLLHVLIVLLLEMAHKRLVVRRFRIIGGPLRVLVVAHRDSTIRLLYLLRLGPAEQAVVIRHLSFWLVCWEPNLFVCFWNRKTVVELIQNLKVLIHVTRVSLEIGFVRSAFLVKSLSWHVLGRVWCERLKHIELRGS